MTAGQSTAARRLVWSFIVGLGLTVGLLSIFALRQPAEAQIARIESDTRLAVSSGSRRATSRQAPAAPAAGSEVKKTRTSVPIRLAANLSAPPAADDGPPDAFGELLDGVKLPPHRDAGRRTDRGGPRQRGASRAGSAAALPGLPKAGAGVNALGGAAPATAGSADLAVCMTTERAWGMVGPGKTATVSVDGDQMGAALADDRGFFFTTLFDHLGERPRLDGGERVRIYDGGTEVADVTLRAITGTIDLVNDVVSGTVGGSGFPISVTVYAPLGEPSLTSYSRTVSTDGSGNFVADFQGIWDFVAWDEAQVAYSVGGVQVDRHVYPGESLLVEPLPWNSVMGVAPPLSQVTATLLLSDTTKKATSTITAGATDGWYFWDAGSAIEESDVVVVEFASGAVLSRTVDLLSLTVDAGNDRLVGEAAPGATVRGRMANLTPLGWRDVWTSTTATSPYTVAFDTMADVMPTEWGAVIVADESGDDLALWNHAPWVQASQTFDEVYGRGPSDVGPASEGRVVSLTLSSSPLVYVTEMDWWSWYLFGPDDGLPAIEPGVIVTVEAEGYPWQGVVEVATMTVGADLAADTFTGTVELPSDRVELYGGHYYDALYPVAGSFQTLGQANSAFAVTPSGFDIDHGVRYELLHRTADENSELIYRETGDCGVILPANAVLCNFVEAGVPFSITLYDETGVVQAQLTGTSEEPIGDSPWLDFWSTGEAIEVGDRVQVQSAAGYSQSVTIPDLTIRPDAETNLVAGKGPSNTLVYVWLPVGEWDGMVPLGADGQFAAKAGQLQGAPPDLDLVWGHPVGVEYTDENETWVYDEFMWPRIYARYNMEGGSTVFGRNALPDSTVHITVTDELSQVIVTGGAAAGSGWDGPLSYARDFPEGTIAPSHTVTVDFGEGYADSVHVVSITANADPDTDLVTGTAPPGSYLTGFVQRPWGGDQVWASADVDASGVYTLDFGAEGWDIQYGDEFHLYRADAHRHVVEYWFWLPAPELSIQKWNPSGHARPGGVVMYGIWYENHGNGTSEDTFIVDSLPANTSWAGDTSGVVPEIGPGGTITWNVGALDPDGRDGFMVTLDVLGLTDGDTIDQNCAHISSSSPGDPEPGNDQNCTGLVDVWDDDVELSVDKGAEPDDPAPGEEMIYTIQWCNNRGAATGPVWLTDTLPVSTTLLRLWPDWDRGLFWSEVVTTGGRLVLYAPGLPGDTCEQLHLRLLLDSEIPLGTTLRNRVEIATEGDVDPDNNVREHEGARVSPPRSDLELGKRVFKSISVPDGWVEFFIDYRNHGNTAAHVWITDTASAGLSYDRAQWGGGDQPNADEPLPAPTHVGNALVWDLGVLPVAEDRWFHVTMDLASGLSAGDVVSNCAVVGSDAPEDTPYDNGDCAYATIYPAGHPNLYASKEIDSYQPGNDVIAYRIRFGNSGDQTVYDVTLTDTIPAGSSVEWYDIQWDGRRGAYTETATADRLLVQFERIEPGWASEIQLNVRLDDPQEPLRWYTNTVAIDTPPDDANPADNVFQTVSFSGGEVQDVDVDVGGTSIWGCAYSGPVTVTTAGEERVYGDNCWDDQFSERFQPGDVVTVAAGEGRQPVVIYIPAPFTAHASSMTDTIWGKIDALDGELVTVDPDEGRPKDVMTDGRGNYSALFPDLPRGAEGEVRYKTMVAYAEVTFHRRFQSPDLIVLVDYDDDYVHGEYEAGHTVWITLTESDGSNVKATTSLTTGPTPGWGDGGGFVARGEDWTPPYPDIQPGDWVGGLLNSMVYTTSVRVGTINAALDAAADTVAGTIEAPWLAPDLITVWCDIHEEGGEQIRIDNVDPDGGGFFCDYTGLWDIQPGQNVVVEYGEPDGDKVRIHPDNPAPYLAIEKEAYGTPGEGGNFSFRIRYRNDGGLAAEDVAITDTLTGLSYIGDTSGFPHTGAGAGPIVWQLGTVPPTDGWIAFEVFVEVLGPPLDPIVNYARIATSNPFDQGDPGEKETGWSGHVQPNDAQLGVGKDAWTGDPAPGSQFVYRVSACNGGPEGNTNSDWTTVTDTLPAEVTLVNWWADDAGWMEVASDDHLLVARRPTIDAHHCSNLYLQVELTDTVDPGDELCNDAEIYAENDPGDPGDNEVAWCHNVGEPHVNLYVDKVLGWAELVPGGRMSFDISYGNNGNLPADNVVITDALPVSTTLARLRAYDHNWRFIGLVTLTLVPPNTLVWSPGTVPNGVHAHYQLDLDIDPQAVPGTALTNTVEISPEPDEDTYFDNVDRWVERLNASGPNLWIRKHHYWEHHHQIVYALDVKNVGDAPLSSIWITDTYPVSTTSDGGLSIGHGPWITSTHEPTDRELVIWLEELSAGETAYLDFRVDLDPDVQDVQGLAFTNLVEAPVPGDVDPSNNTDVETAYTGPDLYAEKWIGGGDPRPGSRITFTVRCGNGNRWPWEVSEGATTRLTERLPEGMSFVASLWPDGEPFTPMLHDPGSGTVIWDVGGLGGQDYRWFYVLVDLDGNLEGDDELPNVLSFAEWPELDVDPVPENDVFTYTVAVLAPKLEVGKAYETNRVAGMPVTYTLTITNVGHDAGTSVAVSDTLPAHLMYGGSDGTFDGTDVIWTIPSIAANGGTAAGWLRATLPCTAGVGIVNEAYGVMGSGEGVSGPMGAAVSFDTQAPVISTSILSMTGSIVKGEPVSFNATATTNGMGLTYLWDFGQGPAAGGLTATHTFTEAGEVTVVFTATDTCGFESAATLDVEVEETESWVYLPLVTRNAGGAVAEAGRFRAMRQALRR